MKSAARRIEASSSYFLAFTGREAGALDGAGDALTVDTADRWQPPPHEKHRTINVIHHQTGIRRAARQRHLGAGLVDDETVFVILRKQAANIADVVRKAGDQDMDVVLAASGARADCGHA